MIFGDQKGLIWVVPVFFGLVMVGCFASANETVGVTFKAKAKIVREQGKQINPGEVGQYLEQYQRDSLRYVAYRTLEAQRERLRAGTERWAPLDLIALTEIAQADLDSGYQPLQAAANAHLVWARLEGFEQGSMAGMMRSKNVRMVVDWIIDWKRPGRPIMERRLGTEDLVALQNWAIERLPSERLLLRWSFEQDQRPGQVADFLARDWTDQQLVEVFRMWCTSEGWSPLVKGSGLTTEDSAAMMGSLEDLQRSRDPLIRREARSWQRWMENQNPALAQR